MDVNIDTLLRYNEGILESLDNSGVEMYGVRKMFDLHAELFALDVEIEVLEDKVGVK
tara:strand:- start:681 stop:851 length:171 start_codon:yes stop_codon:yes gene_type:complete